MPRIKAERHQRRAGRAGHRAGDEGRRPRLLLPGGPGVAVGPAGGADARADPPGLFRTLSMTRLARHDHSRRPARRPLRAVRGRPVADLRHHAAGQSRPWRSDRAGGVRDPGAGEHGSASIRSLARAACACRRCSRSASPCSMCCSTARWARPPAAAAGDVRAVDHHPERAAARCSPPTAGGCGSAPSRPHRSRLAAASPIGVMPLLTLVSAIAVILLLNLLFYRTRARPRLPRHLRRSRNRAADGHRHRPHLRDRYGRSPAW